MRGFPWLQLCDDYKTQIILAYGKQEDVQLHDRKAK